MHNDNGQALLEVAVTIGVATIIIAALAITTVIGLRNSQFAQNQAQATKLAQEAIEKVKTMKNRDIPICIGSAPYTLYYWDESNLSNVWGRTFGTYNPLSSPPCADCIFKLQSTPNCGLVQTPQASPESLLDSKFERIVLVEEEGALSNKQKKITAQVSWKDSAGTHESKLITILAGY